MPLAVSGERTGTPSSASFTRSTNGAVAPHSHRYPPKSKDEPVLTCSSAPSSVREDWKPAAAICNSRHSGPSGRDLFPRGSDTLLDYYDRTMEILKIGENLECRVAHGHFISHNGIRSKRCCHDAPLSRNPHAFHRNAWSGQHPCYHR